MNNKIYTFIYRIHNKKDNTKDYIGRLFDSNNKKNNVLISSGNLNTIIKSLGVKKFDENAKNTYNKCEDFKAVFHSRNKLAKGMNMNDMNKNNMKNNNMKNNNMNMNDM